MIYWVRVEFKMDDAGKAEGLSGDAYVLQGVSTFLNALEVEQASVWVAEATPEANAIAEAAAAAVLDTSKKES